MIIFHSFLYVSQRVTLLKTNADMVPVSGAPSKVDGEFVGAGRWRRRAARPVEFLYGFVLKWGIPWSIITQLPFEWEIFQQPPFVFWVALFETKPGMGQSARVGPANSHLDCVIKKLCMLGTIWPVFFFCAAWISTTTRGFRSGPY